MAPQAHSLPPRPSVMPLGGSQEPQLGSAELSNEHGSHLEAICALQSDLYYTTAGSMRHFLPQPTCSL